MILPFFAISTRPLIMSVKLAVPDWMLSISFDVDVSCEIAFVKSSSLLVASSMPFAASVNDCSIIAPTALLISPACTSACMNSCILWMLMPIYSPVVPSLINPLSQSSPRSSFILVMVSRLMPLFTLSRTRSSAFFTLPMASLNVSAESADSVNCLK